MDVVFRSTRELARMLREGEIGCRELLERYADRVARWNPRLNAVVTLDLDRARARADEADRALRRREVWGPLHGVPFTIKDCFETADLLTTCGWDALATHVPPADATAVARLRAAGAVIFGKTNLPTLAADAQSYNPLFGTTNNPWDETRTPGGSSGGAAVALAAGLAGGELGSDIGGSIRTPSNWCGIYGHKPTWGIVPLRGHIPGPPGTLRDSDLNVVGPMGRSADDLDLGLDVLVGPSDVAATAWSIALPPPRRGALGDYRVAAWLDDPAVPVDASVRTVLAHAVDALRRAGVAVDDTVRPVEDFAAMIDVYHALLYPIVLADMPDEGFRSLVAVADGLPADDRSPLARSARAATVRHRDWILLDEARARLRARLAGLFRSFDVLLMPITPVAAFVHDHSEPFPARVLDVNGATRSYLDLFTWIGLATMAHLPATAAPVGRTAAGLPVGIQIVGPHLEDRTTIDFSRRLADVVGGYVVPPAFA